MQIGLLVSGFPPEVSAGAELQARQLADHLIARGHRIDVFTRWIDPHLSKEETRNGYVIHRRSILAVKGLRLIADVLQALRAIGGLSPRPDVLLCYQVMISGLIGVLAQKLYGIPAVVAIRGNREYQIYSDLETRLFNAFVLRQAAFVTVQTPRILQRMQRQLKQDGLLGLEKAVMPKTRVIPNGIELSGRKRSTGNSVLFLGRLVPQKGVADLITVMKSFPETELAVVGDGPERDRLEAMAAGMKVTFFGAVSHAQVADHLQQARMLVLPAHKGDGLPNVILEAMAHGVPVIATQTAGIPDIVTAGKTGFLYSPGDLAQLGRYIQRLISDPDLHRQLGDRSIEAVKAYSWENSTSRIEHLLAECSRSRIPAGGFKTYQV